MSSTWRKTHDLYPENIELFRQQLVEKSDFFLTKIIVKFLLLLIIVVLLPGSALFVIRLCFQQQITNPITHQDRLDVPAMAWITWTTNSDLMIAQLPLPQNSSAAVVLRKVTRHRQLHEFFWIFTTERTRTSFCLFVNVNMTLVHVSLKFVLSYNRLNSIEKNLCGFETIYSINSVEQIKS